MDTARTTAAICFCLVFVLGSNAMDARRQAPSQSSLKLTDLPPAVQAAAQPQIAGAQLTGISSLAGRLYVLDMLADGRAKQIIIEPDGEVIQVTAHTTLEGFPAPVRTALNGSVAPNASFTKIYRMDRKEKTYYGVDARVDGRLKAITFDPQGTIVAIQEEVALSAAPAAVQAAIEREAKGRRVTKVSTVTQKGALLYYVAAVEQDGKTTEVRVALDGQPYVRQ